MIDFFYSDSHFGHAKIIEYSSRPFKSVEEMNEGLIERYNEMVGPKDEVLFCGDVFFPRHCDPCEILGRLNGVKTLVRGNHDKGSVEKLMSYGFAVVYEEIRNLGLGGANVRVHHYPYRAEDNQTRRPKPEGEDVLIHGHTHSPERVNGNMIHVGVDAWGYRPVPVEDVKELIVEIKHNQLRKERP